MKAFRTSITIPPSVYDLALEVMELRNFTDFSGFLQTLIREEYERRHGPLTLPIDKPKTKPKKHKGNPGRYENADGDIV